ncbi:MAG: acyl carrier protein [Candidatus Omnitrophica bacterium]|nr:acyl carrier protein [Candidatus Omnitrophota bacterium]
MDIKEQVMDLIARTLEVSKDELSETEKLYDSIGVDSTEMVEMVVALNKHFGVKIETNEVTKYSTPLQIVESVQTKKQ